MSEHLFHVSTTAPQKQTSYGSRTDVNAADFSTLKGMALSILELNPGGMREPHWHPNAHELGYCVEGKALMTIFNPGAGHDTFLIEPGTLSFVPMGSLHHIENLGKTPVKIVLCFDNESPEDLDLSSGIAVMPEHVLAATFQLPESFFSGLNAKPKPIFIADKTTHPVLLDAWQTNRFKMNMAAKQPEVSTAGGWVKMSNRFLMPELAGLSMYSLKLAPEGIREPHWHPNAHELNYLISGSARITVLSPGNKVETFDMKAGDMSFLPRGYLHHIENRGSVPADFAVFFNHTAPSDIGLSGSLGAYSNSLLTALFKMPSNYFDKLPKYQSDLFVVKGAG